MCEGGGRERNVNTDRRCGGGVGKSETQCVGDTQRDTERQGQRERDREREEEDGGRS